MLLFRRSGDRLPERRLYKCRRTGTYVPDIKRIRPDVAAGLKPCAVIARPYRAEQLVVALKRIRAACEERITSVR